MPSSPVGVPSNAITYDVAPERDTPDQSGGRVPVVQQWSLSGWLFSTFFSRISVPGCGSQLGWYGLRGMCIRERLCYAVSKSGGS